MRFSVRRAGTFYDIWILRSEITATVVVSSLWLDRNVANRWIPAPGPDAEMRCARLLQRSQICVSLNALQPGLIDLGVCGVIP